MPVPQQCQSLAREIEGLKNARNALQTRLQSAATGQKPGLVSRIEDLNSLIDAKTPALDACVAQYGGPPPPQPLAASLTGTMSLTTDRSYPGEPYGDTTTWGLLFDGPRTQVFVTAFPDWVLDTTKAAPSSVGGLFGDNITTISQNKTGGGNGYYSKADGTLVLPLKLHFDHSRELWPYQADSDLNLVLTTASPGFPVTAAGQVSLAGSGVFSGGWLNGGTCNMIVTGTLTPVP